MRRWLHAFLGWRTRSRHARLLDSLGPAMEHVETRWGHRDRPIE